MAIQSDSSGFLIGERRLKEMASGITKTEDNTKQILKVLSDSFEELQKAYSTSSTQVADAIGRQNRSGRSQDASDATKTARTARKTVDAAEQAVDASKQALFAAKRINKKAAEIETSTNDAVSKSGGVSSTKERAEKARDSSGRFVGKDGSDSEKKGLFSKAKEFLGLGGGHGGGLGGDASGIDPTLDALKELNEAVTPVKNVFKGMSARAVGIIRGRMKKRRADIVLPEEQVKANKETAKTDKKHTKLFESILRAIRGQNGAGGGGLGGDAIGRQNRSGRSQDASDTTKTARTARKTVDAAEQAVGASKQALFVGKDGSDSEKKGLYSKAKEFFGGGGNGGLGGDATGIDPTLDALKELNEAVTPVKNVFKGMSARAVGIIRGRMKKRRADIVLPEEQVKANKETAKTDKKHTKLFESILRAIRGQNGAGGGGLLGGLLGAFGKKGKIGKLGGLLGGLFKGGAKGLLKKIPFLGALIGGGLLAKDWGKLNAGGKGKGIGGIIGTVVGGALGSFFGPVGTVAGGALGNILGGIFGRKVGEWTESLKKIDFGAMFSSLLDDTKKYWKEKLDAGKENAVKAGGTFLDWGKGVLNTVGNTFSQAWRDTTGGDSEQVAGKASASYKSKNFTPEKATKIAEVANRIGVNPNDLASIISFETGGTFSPSKKNPNSSATGLIQFMKGSGGTKGEYYGMTRENFAGLSFDEQMNYVEKYYKDRGFDGKKKRSVADAYTAVTGYGYRDIPKYNKKGKRIDPYHLNRVWDSDDNGYIAKGEMVKNEAFKAHQRKYFDDTAVSPTVEPIQPVAPTKQPSIPAAKGNPKQALIFPQGATRMPPIKVPAITPALAKIGTNTTAKAVSAAPSDAGIAQTVADRSLAHVISGGIGYNTHNT